MAVSIQLPDSLRRHTGGHRTVEVDARSVREALERLEAAHPSLRAALRDGSGNVRRFVNILANAEDIRFLDNLATALCDGAEVRIVPAVAAGWY